MHPPEEGLAVEHQASRHHVTLATDTREPIDGDQHQSTARTLESMDGARTFERHAPPHSRPWPPKRIRSFASSPNPALSAPNSPEELGEAGDCHVDTRPSPQRPKEVHVVEVGDGVVHHHREAVTSAEVAEAIQVRTLQERVAGELCVEEEGERVRVS